MVLRGHPVSTELAEHQVLQELVVRQDHQGHQVRLEHPVELVLAEHQVLQELVGHQVLREQVV